MAISYPITELLMAIYDHAEGMSQRENVAHREVFEKLLQLVEVEGIIRHQKGELERITQKIRDTKADIVILKSLTKGVKGRG